METLAQLNDPVDQGRLSEAECPVEDGEVTNGDAMGRLVAERVQRDADIACDTASTFHDQRAGL